MSTHIFEPCHWGIEEANTSNCLKCERDYTLGLGHLIVDTTEGGRHLVRHSTRNEDEVALRGEIIGLLKIRYELIFTNSHTFVERTNAK